MDLEPLVELCVSLTQLNGPGLRVELVELVLLPSVSTSRSFFRVPAKIALHGQPAAAFSQLAHTTVSLLVGGSRKATSEAALDDLRF